jgi:hypothetical protein
LKLDTVQELEHGFTVPEDQDEDLPSEAETAEEEETYQEADDRARWRWLRDSHRQHTAWFSEIERRKVSRETKKGQGRPRI